MNHKQQIILPQGELLGMAYDSMITHFRIEMDSDLSQERAERMVMKILHALRNDYTRASSDVFYQHLPDELKGIYLDSMIVKLNTGNIGNLDDLIVAVLLEDKKSKNKDFKTNMLVLKSLVVFFRLLKTRVSETGYTGIRQLLPADLWPHIEHEELSSGEPVAAL